MINPNIATKVFKIFSQMAQSTFCYHGIEENVEDMSGQSGRLSSRLALGFLIRNC